ncbi:MAG: ATP-binding protein [Candidatus Omnitrophica bacterium]|nr:ATP-binding protein [Candidatus Omnitrophota bacterium]MDD5672192.1 ATP-binding protein [Candidatus Omnitrophota bacterium]
MNWASFFSNNFLSPYAIPYLVVALSMLVLGVFVYSHHRKSLTHISYLSVCLSTGLWLLVNYFAISSTNDAAALFWAKFVYIGITMVPVSMYFFSVAWLDLYPQKKGRVKLYYLIGAVFILLFLGTDLFVTGVYHYFFGYFSKLSAWSYAYLAFWFWVSADFFITLFQGYRRETVAMKKMHIQRVLIAFVIAFGGSVDFWVTLGFEVYPVSFLTVGLFALICGHAIISYKLMDIETVVHKTLMWLAASSFVYVPILLLSYYLQPWYREASALQVSVLCVAVFCVLTIYLKNVQPHIDHWFQRRKFDLDKASEGFIGDIVHLKSPSELIAKIEKTIGKTLYAERVSVFLYKASQKGYLLVNRGLDDKAPVELPEQNPFVKWLAEHNELVYRDFIESDPQYESVRGDALTYFGKLDAVIAIPLVLDESPLGIINVSRKANLKAFSAYELHFLKRFKNESTIALSNSLLYGRIEEEVKLRTQELVETQQQLIQAEKLATMGTLAGGVAHEINNPLTAILTNVQMLMADTTDEMEKESLELIEQATERCRVIVKKLMVYARKPMEAAAVQMVDLAQVIRNTVEFLRYQFQQDNIEIVLKMPAPAHVHANQNEMEQVLTNMLLNARDAIKEAKHTGTVEIVLGETPDQVTVEIKDDGCGMPEDRVTKIFDPFYTTKDVGKGTGLGLSICQAIIEKCQGSITVKSALKKGTTFRIQLPPAKHSAAAQK